MWCMNIRTYCSLRSDFNLFWSFQDSPSKVDFTYSPENTKVSVPSGSPFSELDAKKSDDFHRQFQHTKETTSAANSAYNSDSELASITKILDTTDAARFKNFFKDNADMSPVNRPDCTIQKAQYISVLSNGNENTQLDVHLNTSDQVCRYMSTITTIVHIHKTTLKWNLWN